MKNIHFDLITKLGVVVATLLLASSYRSVVAGAAPQRIAISDNKREPPVRDGAFGRSVPSAKLNGPFTSVNGEPLVVDPTGSQPPPGAKLARGTLNWGDGEETNWTGEPVLRSHVYRVAGAFTILLTIWDSHAKTATATTSVEVATAPTLSSRVDANALSYRGWFTVPAGFEYGGTALGFDPVRNSLFMASGQSVAEISIPPLGERAVLLQPFADVSEGLSVGAADVRIGGTLVHEGELYFTKYIYYDATNIQTESLFVRPLNLGVTGHVRGPYRVGPLKAGFYSGYMTHVPASLQASLGGPVLTGNCCLGIITRTSFGPAAFALDPSVAIVQQNASPLVYYPADHPTLGPWAGVSPYFGASDSVTGLVVPEGFGSALFFGQHGTTYCYGGYECNDPTSPYQGVHGYPYLSYVWAYAVQDLADVRAGLKQPWEVKPYAAWRLPELAGSKVGGVAYDASTRRIFVSQYKGDGERPLIHVYTLR